MRPSRRRLGHVVRLEALAETLLDEERLEHVLDPLRRADHALDACSSAARSVTETRSPGSASPSPLRSTVTGVPGTKYGSPIDELAALVELDDQTRRKRRMVMDEPAAPSTRPSKSTSSAVYSNAIAFTSLPASSRADRRRQDELLPEEEQHDRGRGPDQAG